MRVSAISFDRTEGVLPAGAAITCGDSLEQDVAGANAAGAHTVWLNREGLTNDTGIKADYEISSLTDLPEILGVECQGHAI